MIRKNGIIEVKEYNEDVISDVADLWQTCFGDTEEFVYAFFREMPVHSTICCYEEDILASMAVLVDISGNKKAYYGYAVCTDPSYRGMGLCRRIHGYIKNKCLEERARYFIHPADDSLVAFYKRLGLKAVTSYYSVRACSYSDNFVKKISSREYSEIRCLYHGGYDYYPWSVEALSFLEKNGVDFVTRDFDGICCAAAVEGDTIIELCAPDHLCGRACASFLPSSAPVGNVRFFVEVNHADPVALMSFDEGLVYFNLFFE